MADQKISELPEITSPSASDNLVIVTGLPLSPVSRRISFENIVTVDYAQIYTINGAATQALPTEDVWEKLDQFNLNGADNNAVADSTNNRIVATSAGTYIVSFNLSFSANTGDIFQAQVRWNNIEQNQIRAELTSTGNTNILHFNATGIVNANVAGEDFEVWVRCTSGSNKRFDLKEGTLLANKVSKNL